MTSIVKIWN